MTSSSTGLDLGAQVIDEHLSAKRVTIPQGRRPEHIAVLGKTGSGKSFLIRHFAEQDIEALRGFLCFDLHGDTMPFLLKVVAAEEQRTGADLSERLIVIEPADAV